MISDISARSIYSFSNFSLGTKDKISFRSSPLAHQVCANANPKFFITFHYKYMLPELVDYVLANLCQCKYTGFKFSLVNADGLELRYLVQGRRETIKDSVEAHYFT